MDSGLSGEEGTDLLDRLKEKLSNADFDAPAQFKDEEATFREKVYLKKLFKYIEVQKERNAHRAASIKQSDEEIYEKAEDWLKTTNCNVRCIIYRYSLCVRRRFLTRFFILQDSSSSRTSTGSKDRSISEKRCLTCETSSSDTTGSSQRKHWRKRSACSEATTPSGSPRAARRSFRGAFSTI